MTIPQKRLPAPRPPNIIKTILSHDEEDERLALALAAEEKWVNDFIKRLNGTTVDIFHKK